MTNRDGDIYEFVFDRRGCTLKRLFFISPLLLTFELELDFIKYNKLWIEHHQICL
jgi:hypothetical protein